MQKPTKIALAALAGLIAIGGAAAANQGWRIGHRGHGPMDFSQLAERYDTNKDSKISQDEIDANRSASLTEFDADKSGTLALAEFQSLWLKAHNQQMVRDFQRLDRDANGQITAEEYKLPLANLVAQLDRDKDKAISADEFSQGRPGPMKRHGEMGPDQENQDAQ